MNIIFNKRDPVYKQVVDHFKQLIANEELDPGQEIPSRRELANQLKINPNTAQRAYKEMEDEALIYTDSNQPSKITKDGIKIKQVKEELVSTAVGQFVGSMRQINMSVEDCIKIVEQEYKKTVNR